MAIAQESLSQALLEGTREVFETMMFMTVEQSNEMYEGIDGEALLGSITFEGVIEGCLGICTSIDSARMIAGNMTGNDDLDTLSSVEIADAMGEVANMVMGAIKGRLVESGDDIHVSIPTVVRGTELQNSLGDDAQEITETVSLDDSIARLTLLYRFPE
ncbi:MAG: chemotaxis protein CheX [Sedimentisphaerales bacterium]|nr:chemotaxis protein CheX [Sedimentisphaerales bacterium]